MPREIVTVQVGQCGNQIGRSFWDLAVKEHAAAAQDGRFDAAMSSYFRNVDAQSGLDVEGLESPVSCLKARAVLVDTEEGVLGQTLAGPLGELFDEREFVKGVSGAGNNFAHGFYGYGAEYSERVLEATRRVAERCDSLQAFFLTHSTGGGTGSGLGTKLLQVLADGFPEALRFTASVFPSGDDDVVTSPYNAAFAVHQLREHADCVFPLDNQALIDICRLVGSTRMKKATVTSLTESLAQDEPAKRIAANENWQRGARPSARMRERAKAEGAQSADKVAFEEMNMIAAHMLSNLTCCARFHGKMNVDISELTTNLVPFPKMQFIVSSVSPLFSLSDQRTRTSSSRNVDQTFAGAFARSNQLLKCDPANGTSFACAMLMRGAVNLSDLNRNVKRLADQVDLVSWNPEGFKVGHCSVPTIGYPHSLLSLSNNTCVAASFAEMEQRFRGLYGPRRKAFVHHYTAYTEASDFEQALETLQQLQEGYASLSREGLATEARPQLFS